MTSVTKALACVLIAFIAAKRAGNPPTIDTKTDSDAGLSSLAGIEITREDRYSSEKSRYAEEDDAAEDDDDDIDDDESSEAGVDKDFFEADDDGDVSDERYKSSS